MKILVDELPFWEDDCPFFNLCTEDCKLDDCECKYMTNHTAGHRVSEDCRWLVAKEGDSE